MRIGGIEAGGTKMVCAIGEVQTDKGQPGENQVTITERVTIPTEKPKITLPRMAAFFEGKGISSLGIGCFGPVDLHRASPDLWIYHQHAEAGMAERRYGGNFFTGARRPGRI